jgi:N-acetylglutamate synthase/N-acetylornithine aminotransferase
VGTPATLPVERKNEGHQAFVFYWRAVFAASVAVAPNRCKASGEVNAVITAEGVAV